MVCAGRCREEESACVPPVAVWGRGRSTVPFATLTCFTRPWLLYFSRDPSPSLGIDNSRNCWKTARQATCGPGADGGCAGRAESRRDHRDLMHVPHGGPGLLMAIPVNSENVARSVSPKPVSCTKGPCRAAVSPVWRQRRHPGSRCVLCRGDPTLHQRRRPPARRQGAGLPLRQGAEGVVGQAQVSFLNRIDEGCFPFERPGWRANPHGRARSGVEAAGRTVRQPALADLHRDNEHPQFQVA